MSATNTMGQRCEACPMKGNYQKQLSKVIIKEIPKIIVITTKSKITTDQIWPKSLYLSFYHLLLFIFYVQYPIPTTTRFRSQSSRLKRTCLYAYTPSSPSLSECAPHSTQNQSALLSVAPSGISIPWSTSQWMWKLPSHPSQLTPSSQSSASSPPCTQHAQCVIIAACVVDLGNQ